MNSTTSTCLPGEGNVGWREDDPCACTLDAMVWNGMEWVDTGFPGCTSWEADAYQYQDFDNWCYPQNALRCTEIVYSLDTWQYKECDPEVDNSVTCRPCSPGTFSSSSSQAECELCPAGSFNPSTGSTSVSECEMCPAGTSSYLQGSPTSNNCQPCTRGSFSSAGAASCSPCPAGTYDSTRGAAASLDDCAVCPDGLHSLPGSTAASDCFDNSLTFNLHIVEAARFSSYSKATSEFQPVAEGGDLADPFEMIFISTTNLLITAFDGVLEFRYDGTFVGLFASATFARGLLLLPDLGQVAVSSTKQTGNQFEKRVLFFALREGINGGALNEVQAAGKVVIPLTATHPFITEDVVRVGGASNQILVGLRHETGNTRKVFKCCIPNTDCTGDPQALINNFFTDTSTHPWRIAIHAFDFSGTLISTASTPNAASGMAFKPGGFAPLATLSLPPAPSVIEPLKIEIVLRDRFDQPLPKHYDAEYETSNLAISARGSISVSDELEDLVIPLEGTIVYTENATIEASVEVKFAGDWDIEILETSVLSSEPIAGSPLSINVRPGPTVASESTVDALPTVVAGGAFTVTVSTSDAFGNPTKREDDKFTAYIGDDVIPLAYSSETHSHSFSTAIPKAGVYLYTVKDTAGLLVGGTQLGLQVVHGEVDATASSVSAGNITGIVSVADTPLSLQVFPRDSFDNAVPDATGFAVQVQGLAGVAERYPLEAPGFLHTITVPADTDATLLISFFLDGEQIDEAVEITVAPPPPFNHTNTYIAAGIAAFLLFLATAAFCWQRSQMNKKRKVERVEREKELKLSMDEKLVGDVGTDLANPIEVALTLQPGREWFLALIIVVGILALVQAHISIPVRRKMLKHYDGIVNGDMLHIYAEAEYGKKKEGERTVGEDNLKVSDR
ncbi:hypothetical protein TeGR_g2190 [Tetraparma gracilis]|uniref:Tyrosine-protein kinase ephrin type A/B receptor-like domain-containing protein n=1 Tax=Tetraparma gracilis TaxID=2962635 RepID=A0ABQ6M4H9_9STRA|nr:hypothetical protein TeGR_g2190 [Tetraparma gracilis]